jgi:hypothetical protein
METESDEDRPSRPRRNPLYNIFGVCALCGVTFALGAAWGGSGRASTSEPGTSQVVGFSGGGLEDEDDTGLEQTYEQGAAMISADWYPHATDEVVTEVHSELNGTVEIPEDHHMKLYHQTSLEACEGIMSSNFRLGKGGWCGRAIYFAVSPYDTKRKAVAGSSGHGCMLEATVNVGRIKRFYTCGKFNALTIKGANRNGADTVLFEPPEKSGDEVIVFDPNQVISKRIIPFNPNWMSHRWHGHPNR